MDPGHGARECTRVGRGLSHNLSDQAGPPPSSLTPTHCRHEGNNRPSNYRLLTLRSDKIFEKLLLISKLLLVLRHLLLRHPNPSPLPAEQRLGPSVQPRAQPSSEPPAHTSQGCQQLLHRSAMAVERNSHPLQPAGQPLLGSVAATPTISQLVVVVESQLRLY